MSGPGAERGGHLYVCGCTGRKGTRVLPVAGDAMGHCVFPTRLTAPGIPEGTLFVSAAADTACFAALDTAGGLWAWAKEGSASAGAGIPHSPACVVRSGVVAYAVGAAFVVAAVDGGTRLCCLGKLPWPTTTTTTTTASGKRGATAAATKAATAAAALLPTVCTADNPVVGLAACAAVVVLRLADGSLWALGKGCTRGLGSAHAGAAAGVPARIPAPPVRAVALGSRHAAAVGADGTTLLVWGEGLSGNLGLGRRVSMQATPRRVPDFPPEGLTIVSVACTRGQEGCKRMGSAAGQEGPRMHVVLSDGSLWIAGTTHKGLGADHLHKTMQPRADLLSLSRVGGRAADRAAPHPVPTGAAEDLSAALTEPRPPAEARAGKDAGTPLRQPPLRGAVARRMGMADCGSFGLDGNTNYLTAARIIASQPLHIHSVALSADGRWFAWGCGSDGRLGLRAFVRGPGGSKRKLKCYVSTPSAVEAVEDRRVLFVTGGRYFSLAIVEPPLPEAQPLEEAEAAEPG